MTIKGDQADFADILDSDYFVRYAACEKILAANDIPLKIADLRQVFCFIVKGFDSPDKEAGQHFLQAQAKLERFIREFGQPLDYSKLTAQDINEYFLDACYRISTRPDLAMLKELAEQGANINVHDEAGFAALKHATNIYDYDIMKFFLERGADINEKIQYRDQKSSTVWLNKVGYAGVNDLQLMLSYGARADDSDSSGNTPLMNYCKGNPVREGVALLIDYGAKVAAVNADGNSALHLIASANADAEAVKLLIKAGADVNLLNCAGETALHVNSRFQLAGTEKITISLLENGANPNCRDAEGNTPLILAATCQKELVVKALMEHGASNKVKNGAGKTAYDIALDKGFVTTASHIDPQAFAEYENRISNSGLREIKAQITEQLKTGKQYRCSDKEGYYVFSHREDVYVYENFEGGAVPPVVSTFPTDESALDYLYGFSRLYSSDNATELAIYQEILNSLKR